jgi:hypothetical protein
MLAGCSMINSRGVPEVDGAATSRSGWPWVGLTMRRRLLAFLSGGACGLVVCVSGVGPPGAPAGGDGPHQPRGAGPTAGRRRARRGLRLSAAAGRPRPSRRGGHRRRPPHPSRCRRVPGDRQAGTTCLSSRPTSPPCWPAAPPCRGTACPCWIAPATRRTAASRYAPSRPLPSTTSGSPTPPRSCRSPASASWASRTPAPGVGGGRP